MSRLVGMFRFIVMPLLAVVTLGLAAPAARAAPATKLDSNLAALWTTVLQTPSAQNPFGTGGAAFGCLNLGGTVGPFGPTGVLSCTVKPGTKIFVAASSWECSTFEGNGTTEAELQACAKQMDVQTAPSVTVDGRSVPVTEAETGLLNIVLPVDTRRPRDRRRDRPVLRARLGLAVEPADPRDAYHRRQRVRYLYDDDHRQTRQLAR